MKAILTKEENVNLYLKNIMQLGEALMNAGGNSFIILKQYDDFLRTLAANNIEVAAKYNYPEEQVYNSSPEYDEFLKKKQRFEEELQKKISKTYDPMWQKPLSTSNPIPNTTSP